MEGVGMGDDRDFIHIDVDYSNQVCTHWFLPYFGSDEGYPNGKRAVFGGEAGEGQLSGYSLQLGSRG